MKLSTPFFLVLAAVSYVEATGHDGLSRMTRNHHDVARRNPVQRRAASNVCKARSTTSSSSATVSVFCHSSRELRFRMSRWWDAASSTHKSSSTKKAQPTTATKNNDSNNDDNSVGFSDGLIRLTTNTCGGTGAQKKITGTKGPNGDIEFFNCGVNDGGWKPPMITVDQIVTVELSDALKDNNSPFKACSKYIDTFYKYASQHGLPAILIASIAMQESSCNPGTVGGGGEQGLMQITQEKCVGAPGGNCQDVDFNIRTGTKFFADTLNGNGGSLLKTFGNYNGWFEGMTYSDATKAQWSSCCRCQNNLDYLQQVLNGWLQNVDPYTAHMGKYFNLDVCH
ncbi:lysozyme-like protein [Epithele typhae]|uniref:lysozyme-like protein n=1 Tax=Epithele typhae TaxID=378194 RepID=UPI00200773A4|nr:lysozyme-like protein [Epithele typhae]KAH9931064.1 lysozyme-like protein [Epithele typhae]